MNGMPETPRWSNATISVHADDRLNATTDVAPALHTSTTFRYPRNADELVPVGDEDLTKESPHIYSRLTSPNTTRLEAILSELTQSHALTYSSGLSAFHGLLCFFNPKRIAIGDGYHGCHGVITIHTKLTGLKKIDLFDEKAWDEAGLGKGDIVHIETPLNPTGEAFDIAAFASQAHRRGAYLSVDATFGPPGLQDPLSLGADVVMHSGTKYIGGHSDMLCGVLCVRNEEWWKGLWQERMMIGAVMGSLEGWLGVRSVRTLEIRVRRQSESTEKLVKWLHSALELDGENGNGNSNDERVAIRKTVQRIQHASLQSSCMAWLQKQMPHGYGPVFAITMRTAQLARRLPSKLQLFHHATSLGGVESLIEWRRMSDQTVHEGLLRVSVGLEAWEDLRADFASALGELAREMERDGDGDGTGNRTG